MIAQFRFPLPFAHAIKQFEMEGVKVYTNVPGFGLVALGVALLFAASVGRSSN